MTQQQTERERLADLLEIAWQRFQVGTVKSKDLAVLIEAAALLRGDEPAKPDRYVVALAETLETMPWQYTSAEWLSGKAADHPAAAVLRRHFEPSAEVVKAARFYDVPVSRTGSILARFVLSLQDGAPITGQPLALITDEQIKQITNRFLGWRLPEDFRPDDGISFEPEFNKEWNAAQGKPPQRRTPTGTNLFSYTQAEAMVRFILADFILKGDQ